MSGVLVPQKVRALAAMIHSYKPDKKVAIVDLLEEMLKGKPFFGGSSPTSADELAFNLINLEELDATTLPNVYAWYTVCSKFTDAVRSSWAFDEKR